MNENDPIPALPSPAEESKTQPSRLWIWIAAGVLIVALIVLGIVLLMRADAGVTAQIRDVFIIFMALEAIVIGAALVILIVQLATLINLVQNEVKPILQSTSETVNTLKGTTDFLSQNLVDPVIKLNGTLAGIKRLLDLLKIARR